MDLMPTKTLLRNKLALGLLVAVFASLAVAVPAYAHYVYEEGTVYSGDTCTWLRSEISHGNGGGYSKSKIVSQQDFMGWPCGTLFGRPPNYLRLKWSLWEDGFICTSSSGYTYNSAHTAQMTIDRYHGNTPPCGDGDYETTTTGHHKNGSQWLGGSLDSGTHYLD